MNEEDKLELAENMLNAFKYLAIKNGVPVGKKQSVELGVIGLMVFGKSYTYRWSSEERNGQTNDILNEAMITVLPELAEISSKKVRLGYNRVEGGGKLLFVSLK